MEYAYLKNKIVSVKKELAENKSFCELYENVNPEELRIVFSSIHFKYIELYKLMNTILPTDTSEGHFWAEESRELMELNEICLSLLKTLKDSNTGYQMDSYYLETINDTKSFLAKYGGSTIPIGMKKIELYYTIPIFKFTQNINKGNNYIDTSTIKLIGEGSYAKVLKYKDKFYDKYFAIKRANKNLNQTELKRFYNEFEIMKRINSPYIVEVYKFFEENNEYIMEYLDYSLYDYIKNNNNTINIAERKILGLQFLKAMEHVHNLNLFHRDLAPTNILLKKYTSLHILKLADFGLVKLENSNLTAINTEFKGKFNDPSLELEGFNNYKFEHEVYSIIKVLFFILTGKVNVSKCENQAILNFIKKGLDSKIQNRYASLDEILVAYKKICDFHYT
ncbi:protein kinase family protein [Staphylococcus xylosus]|uniref:protein kinase family protein n=1 Tax=Staphylococcus xylosus TaxID=1288 RepID=UPI0035F543AF